MKGFKLAVLLLALAILGWFQGAASGKPCVPVGNDFKKAQPVAPGPDHWRVTICREAAWIFRIDGPPVDVRRIVNSHGPGQTPAATGHEHGNALKIDPRHTGTTTITADVIPRQGGPTIHITVDVTVIDCNCN